VAALAASASLVPRTGQSPDGEPQKAQAESGLDLLVVDQQGAVCAGAQVELAKDGEPGRLLWKTDQEGTARIQAAPGEYSLTIKLPGFLDYKKRLTLMSGIRSPVTATLWFGGSSDDPSVVEAPEMPTIIAEAAPLDPVPIPTAKPPKQGFWRRLAKLLHIR
jgi:hypothetical protein